ncbi:hypothetical protein BKA66DRAFT_466539 [Pyrenochaeta sp. MPI-SDFR-AT-0127]|nr:hypothetical protein BKA66DRAFT_466539 [Pyrenochaeta sp. MPI-SDFR-AT-0127]
MKAVLKRLKYMAGRDIAIMAPYKAQAKIYELLVEHAILQANSASSPELAHRLEKFLITTVDNMTGNEKPHAIFEIGTTAVFVFNGCRFTVAATHACISMESYGDLMRLSNGYEKRILQSHPYSKIMGLLNTNKAIIGITTQVRKTYYQYKPVL